MMKALHLSRIKICYGNFKRCIRMKVLKKLILVFHNLHRVLYILSDEFSKSQGGKPRRFEGMTVVGKKEGR